MQKQENRKREKRSNWEIGEIGELFSFFFSLFFLSLRVRKDRKDKKKGKKMTTPLTFPPFVFFIDPRHIPLHLASDDTPTPLFTFTPPF